MDEKWPLKLLTEIAYLDKEEWLELRLGLETRNGNKSNYIFVEGTVGNLKEYSDIFENFYVEKIMIKEEREERNLYIQAVKEVSK